MSEKKRCVIVGGADIGDYARVKQYLRADDAIVFCDSGLKHMEALGVKPALIVGDFDSHCNPHLDVETIVLPCEKDDTDTVFAIKTGLEKGYRHFYIYGGLGGKRSDHTSANLQSLLYLANRKARGWLFGENCVWTAIKNSSITLKGEGNVAVFCFDGVARGVTLKGLKYELQNAEVTSDFPIGVSNSMAAEEATVEVTDGALLVMYGIGIGEEN